MKKSLTLITIILLLWLANIALAAPAPPIMALDTNGVNVTISWPEVTDASGYKLHYAPYPFAGMETVGSLDVAKQTSQSFALWKGAAYYITVTSYDASGESEYSNIEYFVLGPPSPEWVDDDGDGVAEVDGDCDDTDSSIYAGGAEICDDGIDQNCSGVDQICPASLTPPILNLVISGFDVSTSWTGVPGATGYKLYYAPNPFVGPETFDSLDVGNQTGQSFSLWRGASYHIVVTAYNEFGESDYSNSETIDIEPDPNDVDNDFDGFTENQGDCDDTLIGISPGNTEVCGDGIDHDCSGADLACPLTSRDKTLQLVGYWSIYTDNRQTRLAIISLNSPSLREGENGWKIKGANFTPYPGFPPWLSGTGVQGGFNTTTSKYYIIDMTAEKGFVWEFNSDSLENGELEGCYYRYAPGSSKGVCMSFWAR